MTDDVCARKMLRMVIQVYTADVWFYTIENRQKLCGCDMQLVESHNCTLSTGDFYDLHKVRILHDMGDNEGLWGVFMGKLTASDISRGFIIRWLVGDAREEVLNYCSNHLCYGTRQHFEMYILYIARKGTYCTYGTGVSNTVHESSYCTYGTIIDYCT